MKQEGKIRSFFVKNIMISAIIMLIAAIFIISDMKYTEKSSRIMEQIGEAVINKDIDLLDEIMLPDCEMLTIDGDLRTYSYQREKILDTWRRETYTVTSYDSDLKMNTCRMMITDAEGTDYELICMFTIRKMGLFDAKVVTASASLFKER